MRLIYLKIFTLLLSALLMCFSNLVAAVENCSAGKYTEIRATATSGNKEVFIACNATLSSSDGITKHLIFEGSAANNVTFDCNGATIDPFDPAGLPAISIRPKRINAFPRSELEGFSRPENVTIKNCVVQNGSVDIKSSFIGGGTERGPTHVNYLRDTSPTNITLDNLDITSNAKRPIYFHQGVTYSSLLNSKIVNHTDNIAIYLSAQSGFNRIENNEFHSSSNGRELFAIDGSENNVITRNWFSGLSEGGIYMYRNCGEGGGIRYSTPSHNEITDNIFYYNNYNGSNSGIYVGSRDGNKDYCPDDAGWLWSYDGVESSSSDDRDFARDNLITGNKICNRDPSDVIEVGFTVNTLNTIFDNSEITCNSSTPIPRPEPGALLITLTSENTGICSNYQEVIVLDATTSGSLAPYTFSWSGVTSLLSGSTENPNSAYLNTSGSASVLVEVTSSDGQTANQSITVTSSCSSGGVNIP